MSRIPIDHGDCSEADAHKIVQLVARDNARRVYALPLGADLRPRASRTDVLVNPGAADDGGPPRRRPPARVPLPQRADQPPPEARMAPLMLVPSSLSRKVMEAASCAAVAGVGTVACISGPGRSTASWDPQAATMLAMVGPGATPLQRGPLCPCITAECLVFICQFDA